MSNNTSPRLYNKRMGNDSAKALATRISRSRHLLQEVHPSHKAIPRDGCKSLIVAATASS